MFGMSQGHSLGREFRKRLEIQSVVSPCMYMKDMSYWRMDRGAKSYATGGDRCI